MEIEFEKEYLRELFVKGKTSNKKHRFQPQVIKQYIKTVFALISAQNTESLYYVNGLNYEKKIGDLKGVEVVWVNNQYRLEFKSRSEGKEPFKITICSLINLSSHYKK